MKIAALATAVTVSFLQFSTAHAETRYTGGFVIYGKTGTCQFYDPTGDRMFARFRPSGITNNGNRSGLSLFSNDGAQSYAVTGRFGPAFKRTDNFAIYDFGDQPIPIPSVRFVTQSPAVLAATTPFIEITGEIKAYDYMPKCTVQFRLSVALRPN